jgi:serine protease
MWLLLAWPCLSSAAGSVVYRAVAPAPWATDRIIVKWRADSVASLQIASVAQRAAHLRALTGVELSPVRRLFGSTDVMQLPYVPGSREMSDILARLNSDPAVQYAEPDAWRYIADFPADGTAPDDPNYVAGTDANGSWEGQWYLQPSSAATPAAIGATAAWVSSGLGSPAVVVAVIDTGIIEAHPDFTYPAGTASTPKLQCNTGSAGTACGYDFVSCDQGNLTAGSGSETTADCSATGSAATYDFANDGHGWAPDAADPGDDITSSDVTLPLFRQAGCTSEKPSSWHGTKVSGVIGAVANNGIGIAGIAPNTTLLPVRALGKCSGRISDIVAAILWASGVGVATDAGTIASNPKANIINLSLVGESPCSQTEQDAVTQAINAGVLLVASAGNEGGPIDAPANCSGVLSVVGLRASGTKVAYSNLSSSDAAAGIGAPGGNCVSTSTTAGISVPCSYAIITSTDAGSTVPAATPGFYTYSQMDQSYIDSGGNQDNTAQIGTSFAAPMVAGVAALMLAAAPDLTPSQLIARLRSSASAFPTSSSTTTSPCQLASTSTDSNGHYTDTSQDAECVCTKATCGAGMLNAPAAVTAASGMYVQINASDSSATPGQRVRLDGSGSTPTSGDTITSWQWTTSPDVSGNVENANQAVATLVFPAFSTITATLTITDSGGHTAFASVKIAGAFAAASGTGAVDPLTLLALAGAAVTQLLRRRRHSLQLN